MKRVSAKESVRPLPRISSDVRRAVAVGQLGIEAVSRVRGRIDERLANNLWRLMRLQKTGAEARAVFDHVWSRAARLDASGGVRLYSGEFNRAVGCLLDNELKLVEIATSRSRRLTPGALSRIAPHPKR